jgi:hypothetical protein
MKKATSRKRPKSVMKKAWETRRLRAAVKKRQYLPLEINREAFLKDVGAQLGALDNSMPQNAQNPNTKPPSDPIGLMMEATPRTNGEIRDEHMVEQLCSFLADMVMVEHMRSPRDHHPIMVSWPQAKALARFLRLNDFSPFGFIESIRKAA